MDSKHEFDLIDRDEVIKVLVSYSDIITDKSIIISMINKIKGISVCHMDIYSCYLCDKNILSPLYKKDNQ